ncbi:NTP transferase domain-containing protein [Paenibacillus sp. GCM10012303]|uniref:phosphocholine cytidylyltransferase family protein n=1 Tax=Paenibacillus sp. GCM10012303 TaxID=3317340 RepID=UPI00360B3A87
MKAVLLAAGRGTRISRYIGEKPKCTLDIGGVSLIRHTVELLHKNNIEVVVVTGYNKEMIINSLEGLNVKYYYNPFYDATNSIASLWFAKKELNGDDILIANADVFWEQEILDETIRNEEEQVLLMDSSRNSDYLFYCDGNRLLDHGKELTEVTGEYIGIANLKKSFLNRFVGRLEALIEKQQHGLWWENVLYSFINELNVNVRDVSGIFWSEIDFIEDYNKIVQYRKEKETMLVQVSK